MSLTPQWLDELRARTVLSTLIGRSVKVTKAGREFKACCPFHNEKTPSFTINDDKGFYHCLSGDTQVLTQSGRVRIDELAGKTVKILSRNGQWIAAPFKSYGTQKLWRISLSRNGVKKSIRATSGHRWFVHDRVREYKTQELQVGHALQSALPPACTDWKIDPEGVRHGIIFGDGSMYKGVYGTLNLHGDKDAELRKWFPGQSHHIHEREGGELYLRVYGGRAFEGMKALPSRTASPAYLLGFLAGYFAADGHVAKDGTVMLNSSNTAHLEAVRDVAHSLGIATFSRTTLMRRGYGIEPSALHRIHFVNSTLTPAFFLLSKAKARFAGSSRKFERLRWVVEGVEESGQEETVYCAEVPGEHAFVLEDNILTGNCFGCGAHGDAIRWMTDQRGLPFMDAVKELAAAAGMDVPEADPRAAERAERANSLYDVMTAAGDWFIQQLQGIQGAEARAYLDQRGVYAETIKTFGLGYAPDSRVKLKAALARFGDAALIEAGLLISVEDKDPYDRFRGRLMIPIRDPRGRVIAFGGRILGAGEPKYLNSPDTPLFDKGRTLYNLDRAAPQSRKSGRIIVVEGYMDVIALAQAGVGDAVAPLGTALTEHQLERLWRLADAPLLCFDGDSAGQKAAVRAIGRALPALAPARSLQFITLPAGQDPDDLIKSGGRSAMETLLAAPEALVDRLWHHELGAVPLATPEARAGLRRRLTEQAQTIADGDVRAQYLAEFRARFETLFLPQRPSKGRFQPRFVAPERPPSRGAHSIGGGGVDPMFGRAILAGLLRHPAMIASSAEALAMVSIADAALDRLRVTLLDAAYANMTLDSGTLIPICESAGLGALAMELNSDDSAKRLAFSFLRRDADADDACRALKCTIDVVAARRSLEAELEAATARMEENFDDAGFAYQVHVRTAVRQNQIRLAALANGDELDEIDGEVQ